MKKLKFLVLPLSALLLTSCISFGDFLNSDSEKPKNPNIFSSTDNNYKHPVVSPDVNYYKAEVNPYDNKVIGNSKDFSLLSSVGKQKILVVPLRFLNSPLAYQDDLRVQEILNKAFFGQSSETGWESVSSFYQKSSYDKLTITGEVSEVINLAYTTSALEKKQTDDYDYWDQSHYALEDAYNALSTQKLREYDSDNDGFVDAAFFVYLAPTAGDLFWAFQYFWNRYPYNSKPEEEKPAFNVYAWASYEFMFEDEAYNEDVPAAHTYIHETGHILGLDDYYDYDSKTAPLGGIDMMDNNIIDHNMYSKFLLNWSLPYVPVGSSEIYLRPAESSGDFILINNKWNGHAYDEYILIEYYTPTGLNEHDSSGQGYGKGTNKTKGFSEAGVRIFHIDSRIVEIRGDQKGNPFPYVYRDSLAEIDSRFYFDYVSSNTPKTSYIDDIKRIHLLDGQTRQTTWYHILGLTGNGVLFKSGQQISSSEWSKYIFLRNTFNDKTPIGYSVLIGDMDEAGVLIKLTAT